MTDKTPERIWVYAPDNPEKIVGCDPMGYAADVDGDEYFLRRYALAAVAEAYEGLAKWAESERHTCNAQNDRSGSVACRRLCVRLRALTPADALAAREARDKRVRGEALREAATIAQKRITGHGDHHEEDSEAQTIATEILALISEDKTDE